MCSQLMERNEACFRTRKEIEGEKIVIDKVIHLSARGDVSEG